MSSCESVGVSDAGNKESDSSGVSDKIAVGLKPPLTLKWKNGKDMPLKMESSVQSVVLGNTVFVGGGRSFIDSDSCTVMALDLQSDCWSKLPLYDMHQFAMTYIEDRLVLVGGCKPGGITSTDQVAVLESDKWTHPYPPMNIARHNSAAVSYGNHIIVAGGLDKKGRITSTVEVLDVKSSVWYVADPLPFGRVQMKATTIGNTLYLMGGIDDTATATKVVHSINLRDLTAQATTSATPSTPSQWQTLEDAPFSLSTPVGVNGSLLAFGGSDGVKVISSIHLYQPEAKQWVNVGDLPTARCNCASSVLSNGEIIVAGGFKDFPLNCVDILSILTDFVV